MNALSPVSADLIGRLRAYIVKEEREAEKRDAVLFVDHPGYRLLKRAENATKGNAWEVTRDALRFLKEASHK